MASPYISAQMPGIYLFNMSDLNNLSDEKGQKQISDTSRIRPQLEEYGNGMSRHAPEPIYRNGDGFFDFGVQLIILPIPFLLHLY